MQKLFSRRDVARLGLGLGAAALAGREAFAQGPAFFRIGTGGTAGTYYPVGGLIANVVSNPPNLIVTAQAANGSVANVNGIASGAIESGFSQADVAYWAYTGTGLFEGKGKVEVLRLIALGHTNSEIAELLTLSTRTVESHRAHIQRKLGRTTRAELVRYALDRGLVTG